MIPILVAGLGRCGSSLVMQMIEATGVPCFGEFPAFEPREVSIDERSPQRLLEVPMAMKILSPQLSKWPLSFEAKIIWLDRDVREQAKSQVKFLQMVAGAEIGGQAWRAIAKGLGDEKALCYRWLKRSTCEPLLMTFDEIVTNRLRSARRIAAYIGQGDALRMSTIIRPRGVKCEPGMDIEMCLIGAVR